MTQLLAVVIFVVTALGVLLLLAHLRLRRGMRKILSLNGTLIKRVRDNEAEAKAYKDEVERLSGELELALGDDYDEQAKLQQPKAADPYHWS